MANTDLTKIDLYETTLSTADMSNINENAQYNIKDMPIGGITNAEMVLALQSTKQGIFRVGSVYMCTDTVANQYEEKHFYKFTGLAWEDVTGDITVVDSALDTNSTNPVENRVVTNALNGKQAEITSSNKLSADLVYDTDTANKFVTTSEKNTWNAKQNALSSSQLDAVNSGIDSTKVVEITTNTSSINALQFTYLTITLDTNDWVNNEQEISVGNITPTSIIWVSPTPIQSNVTNYSNSGILATGQGNGTITFSATTTPLVDISVNLIINNAPSMPIQIGDNLTINNYSGQITQNGNTLILGGNQ